MTRAAHQSERARYRKIYVRIWRHKEFIPLDGADKALVLYCLSGPQTNRIGLYVLSPGTAAEDLGLTLAAFKSRLAAVCPRFGWRFDAASRVLLIPSWWEWNEPENKNVLKGALKDLSEVPDTPLRDEWAAATRKVCGTHGVTFPERMGDGLPDGSGNVSGTLPKRTPIQEQEQEQVPRPPVAPHRGAIPMRPAKLRRRAEEFRSRVWMRCRHDPPCDGYEPCIARLVDELRSRGEPSTGDVADVDLAEAAEA